MQRRDLHLRPFPNARKLIILSVGFCAALIVLLAAPLIYIGTVGMSDRQLGRISNIGQAYGVASAILSVVALSAVTGSLLYQARQDRAFRADAIRANQRVLMNYAIAEPSVFLPCIADPNLFETDDEARRYLFTSLWLNFVRQGYETGDFDEQYIRIEFANSMARSPIARELWQKRKGILLSQPGVTSLPPFLSLFDEEYSEVVSSAGEGIASESPALSSRGGQIEEPRDNIAAVPDA
jgi:hypothetical protein